jgi:hypothetical protein
MLGMAPLPELPINDKVLHFFGVSYGEGFERGSFKDLMLSHIQMGIAVFLLYFVIDVPE